MVVGSAGLRWDAIDYCGGAVHLLVQVEWHVACFDRGRVEAGSGAQSRAPWVIAPGAVARPR